jgi:hypothetical protein
MTNAGNRGKRRSRIKALLDSIRRFFGRKPTTPPGDPYAYVGAPLRRGPKGRSGAAVAEIEDNSFQSFPPRRK